MEFNKAWKHECESNLKQEIMMGVFFPTSVLITSHLVFHKEEDIDYKKIYIIHFTLHMRVATNDYFH